MFEKRQAQRQRRGQWPTGRPQAPASPFQATVLAHTVSRFRRNEATNQGFREGERRKTGLTLLTRVQARMVCFACRFFLLSK